ncbi:hypothetical protein, partial [Bacillus subtilis]|uniref:hypothetical protein n=1 Tax=Bacillus subtilis TaxID=1423 RepID=UPI001BDB9600
DSTLFAGVSHRGSAGEQASRRAISCAGGTPDSDRQVSDLSVEVAQGFAPIHWRAMSRYSPVAVLRCSH